MIPLGEAQAEVLAACPPLAPTEIPVGFALRRVLAAPVLSPGDVPPFRNTAMDGFAVRSEDVGSVPARLRVTATLAAGMAPGAPIGPGEAVRIMTGAPLPNGADAVAIVEHTRTDGNTVEILEPVTAGAHIRAAGEDIAAGSTVFPAGTALGPGHLGVLCSVGAEKVLAHPAPIVGVLSTGDELVEGGGPLQPGQIRDSNRRTLLSLLELDGFTPVDLGIARDDEAEIEMALRNGFRRCDAVITSGGVSMGDFDYVKAVLDRIGQMHWMQIAIRPAKPFAFGVVEGTPVFGLPGNPVSSMVSYELLARPALRRMAGHPDADLHRPLVPAVAGSGWRAGRDGRISFVRVRSSIGDDGRLRVDPSPGQGSHQLYSMAIADSLAVTPSGADVSAGDTVEVMVLRPLGG